VIRAARGTQEIRDRPELMLGSPLKSAARMLNRHAGGEDIHWQQGRNSG
jgi:hypothetical protein